MPLPRPKPGDEKVDPAPPTPPPEVRALEALKEALKEKGRTYVTREIIDEAIRKGQGRAGQRGG